MGYYLEGISIKCRLDVSLSGRCVRTCSGSSRPSSMDVIQALFPASCKSYETSAFAPVLARASNYPIRTFACDCCLFYQLPTNVFLPMFLVSALTDGILAEIGLRCWALETAASVKPRAWSLDSVPQMPDGPGEQDVAMTVETLSNSNS